MFEAFKSFYGNNVNTVLKIEQNKMFPLVKWFSYEKTNLFHMSKVNTHAWWVPYEVVFASIFYGINKEKRYIKYLKKSKTKDNDLLIDCLKKVYNCSKSELLKSWEVIEPQLTEEYRTEIAVRCGLDNRECKTIGAKPTKLKRKKPTERKKKTHKNLMDF